MMNLLILKLYNMINLIGIILYTGAQGTTGKNPLQSLWPLLLIIVVFYFFMIRPQVRKQKELRNYRDSLKKGDRVITTGGIYGKINNISDNVITVDAGNNVLLKVDKSAILKDSGDLPAQK
jgi:preprotein translocase subunit YajC